MRSELELLQESKEQHHLAIAALESELELLPKIHEATEQHHLAIAALEAEENTLSIWNKKIKRNREENLEKQNQRLTPQNLSQEEKQEAATKRTASREKSREHKLVLTNLVKHKKTLAEQAGAIVSRLKKELGTLRATKHKMDQKGSSPLLSTKQKTHNLMQSPSNSKADAPLTLENCPENLKDPVSLEIMRLPVVISSGGTLCLGSLLGMFQTGRTMKDPKTQALVNLEISAPPNMDFYQRIISWCDEHHLRKDWTNHSHEIEVGETKYKLPTIYQYQTLINTKQTTLKQFLQDTLNPKEEETASEESPLEMFDTQALYGRMPRENHTAEAVQPQRPQVAAPLTIPAETSEQTATTEDSQQEALRPAATRTQRMRLPAATLSNQSSMFATPPQTEPNIPPHLLALGPISDTETVTNIFIESDQEGMPLINSICHPESNHSPNQQSITLEDPTNAGESTFVFWPNPTYDIQIEDSNSTFRVAPKPNIVLINCFGHSRDHVKRLINIWKEIFQQQPSQHPNAPHALIALINYQPSSQANPRDVMQPLGDLADDFELAWQIHQFENEQPEPTPQAATQQINNEEIAALAREEQIEHVEYDDSTDISSFLFSLKETYHNPQREERATNTTRPGPQ